jgi:hypothetical protein
MNTDYDKNMIKSNYLSHDKSTTTTTTTTIIIIKEQIQ